MDDHPRFKVFSQNLGNYLQVPPTFNRWLVVHFGCQAAYPIRIIDDWMTSSHAAVGPRTWSHPWFLQMFDLLSTTKSNQAQLVIIMRTTNMVMAACILKYAYNCSSQTKLPTYQCLTSLHPLGGSFQLVSGQQPPFISHLGNLEGERPYLGNLYEPLLLTTYWDDPPPTYQVEFFTQTSLASHPGRCARFRSCGFLGGDHGTEAPGCVDHGSATEGTGKGKQWGWRLIRSYVVWISPSHLGQGWLGWFVFSIRLSTPWKFNDWTLQITLF